MFEFYSEFSEMQQVTPVSNGNSLSIPITKVISWMRDFRWDGCENQHTENGRIGSQYLNLGFAKWVGNRGTELCLRRGDSRWWCYEVLRLWWQEPWVD